MFASMIRSSLKCISRTNLIYAADVKKADKIFNGRIRVNYNSTKQRVWTTTTCLGYEGFGEVVNAQDCPSVYTSPTR